MEVGKITLEGFNLLSQVGSKVICCKWITWKQETKDSRGEIRIHVKMDTKLITQMQTR